MPSLLSHLQRDSQDFYGLTFEDNYEMPPNEKQERRWMIVGATSTPKKFIRPSTR